MPLYEYKCERCGNVFERIQRFSDEPLTVHEECGGPVHRLISKSALQFKGSGWYITDYAKSGSGPNGGEKSSDKAETKSPAKTEGKSGDSSSSSSSESSSKGESKADSTKTSSSSSSEKTGG